jgi:large subunit ribosomal protein L46
MNTWVVGNHPVGHFHYNYPKPLQKTLTYHERSEAGSNEKLPTYEQEHYGEKVFFMKTRIMAGQADLKENVFGDQDFEWLAKEEIEEKVTRQYWAAVRNMLVER